MTWALSQSTSKYLAVWHVKYKVWHYMCGRKVDISQERTNKETNKQTKQANKPSLCPRWRWHLLGEVGNSQLTNFFGPTSPLGPNLRKGTFYMGTSHKMGKKTVFNGVKPKTFLQMAENQQKLVSVVFLSLISGVIFFPTYIYLQSGKKWTFLAKDLRLGAFAPFGRDTLIAGRWRRCLQL